MLETFFTLLATTARRERFLLRPFRSQGLAVDKLEDKLEDQLLEDQNILNFVLHKCLGSFITVQGLNIQEKKEIRSTAAMNTCHDKVKAYSCCLKDATVNWSS